VKGATPFTPVSKRQSKGAPFPRDACFAARPTAGQVGAVGIGHGPLGLVDPDDTLIADVVAAAEGRRMAASARARSWSRLLNRIVFGMDCLISPLASMVNSVSRSCNRDRGPCKYRSKSDQ
jgi:hypothetical protein